MRRLVLALALTVAACAPSAGLYRVGDLEMVHAAQARPLAMHRGVWDDVRRCLGDAVVNDVGPDDVMWIRADSVIDRSRDVYVYGAAVVVSGDYHWMVVVESDQWMYAHTVSHEAVHVLANEGGHPAWAFRCEFPGPVEGLPLRVVEGA